MIKVNMCNKINTKAQKKAERNEDVKKLSIFPKA